MNPIIEQLKKQSHTELTQALEVWDYCKPPYSREEIKCCMDAAKKILAASGQPRRSKYESASFLRIDFSKAGKVTFYAEFPKKMELKGKKLGEWPEIELAVAREKAQVIATGAVRFDSVHGVISMYEKDLAGKVSRLRLGEDSYATYLCRLKHVRQAFSSRESFSEVGYKRIIEVLNGWICSKTNNHALELFAELRRVWKFGAPFITGGRNVAGGIPDDYVSSRVQAPTPTRLFTDIESISKLWVNLASCTSVHQKNAVRFMILTGLRPINICNLKWEYIKEEVGEIVYPAGVNGMRGAMKTQKEFRLPITSGMQEIIREQAAWRDEAAECNQEYVFLQPSKPSEPFAKRSLDSLTKRYSPEGAVKGDVHSGTVKGRSGAFNTMCRKFLKSNVIAQLRARGVSRTDTREISLLCLHHSDKSADSMAEHYDFSDEVLQEEILLKRQAFEAHEASIMAQVAAVKVLGL